MPRRGPEAPSVNNIAMAALCSMSINTIPTPFKTFSIDLNSHRHKMPIQAYIYEYTHRIHCWKNLVCFPSNILCTRFTKCTFSVHSLSNRKHIFKISPRQHEILPYGSSRRCSLHLTDVIEGRRFYDMSLVSRSLNCGRQL